MRDRDMYTCGHCGLHDDLVECSGIYYCPNPFCGMSGATNWKLKKGIAKEVGDHVEIVSSEKWLYEGLKVLREMDDGLSNKIRALPLTKKIATELFKETELIAEESK